ncbi:MAG TPA: hypothetical protein VFV19_08895 [Candidatus Polarisedimenticolaceae bacterium]|nr:hypothetical protein [Candidatus Polarisedimenticolaceae bacterium]
MRLSRGGALLVLLVGGPAATSAHAVTRELADTPTFVLTFGRSVLNELTFDTYRTPFDELQTRPYNLLFANIARMSNFGAWPGQQGSYARYVDGVIGNNGATGVENQADAINGTMIRRETGTFAWGLSAAVLAGTIKSDATSGGQTFDDNNDLKSADVRGGAAFQLNNSTVLGVGLRTVWARHDATSSNFAPGVGGFNGVDNFDQLDISADAGVRRFLTPTSSWEIDGVLGYGSSTKDVYSEDIDDTGAVTDRFTSTNYDINDLSFGVTGGYNRLRKEGLGETEYRGGLSWSQRKLGNSDLASSETGGVVTPDTTLLGQNPITTLSGFGSARMIFQAGETEMFVGARLGYDKASGSSDVDAAGTPVREEIDDSQIALGLTLGVRQPLFKDKLRIIVSGHADLLDSQTKTTFDTGSQNDKATLTAAQFAIGLETVLANVTLDLAWLTGEAAPSNPIPIGIPEGSRRTIQLDKLVLSAAVSW